MIWPLHEQSVGEYKSPKMFDYKSIDFSKIVHVMTVACGVIIYSGC